MAYHRRIGGEISDCESAGYKNGRNDERSRLFITDAKGEIPRAIHSAFVAVAGTVLKEATAEKKAVADVNLVSGALAPGHSSILHCCFVCQ